MLFSILPVDGAPTVFDKRAYTWTDKIFITITAPDFNFDTFLIDEIGNDSFNPIKISTRGHTLNQYKLVETGPNTGIFVGEVILTGFCHDADGNRNTDVQRNSDCRPGDDTNPRTEPLQNGGPTNGFLEASNDDGISVSFEYSDKKIVLASAPIKWDIGDLHWLESYYLSNGVGILRVIDPDMNLNPEAVDNFGVDIWSTSDSGGIDLIVAETGEMTGIFEGSVFFTTTNESSGSRLRVAEGDLVTAEYKDHTLSTPYTIADNLSIKATTNIGKIISTSKIVSIENIRITNSLGVEIVNINEGETVQVVSNIQSKTPRDQPFIYLVQIKDSENFTIHLAWVTGLLSTGQAFDSALSWLPNSSGSYEISVYVWESLENPLPLSNAKTIQVSVR